MYTRNPQRPRRARCGPDGNGKDGGLPAADTQQARRRRLSRRQDKLRHHEPHTRARTADRPGHAGLCLLSRRSEQRGRLRRQRRQPLRPGTQEPAARSRRGNCHSGTIHIAYLARKRGPQQGEFLRSRRGRPHARHGILGGYHDHRQAPAADVSDDNVLCHNA